VCRGCVRHHAAPLIQDRSSTGFRNGPGSATPPLSAALAPGTQLQADGNREQAAVSSPHRLPRAQWRGFACRGCRGHPDSAGCGQKKADRAVKRCDILVSPFTTRGPRRTDRQFRPQQVVSSMNITQIASIFIPRPLHAQSTNNPGHRPNSHGRIGFVLLPAVAREHRAWRQAFSQGIYPGSQSNHLAVSRSTGKTWAWVCLRPASARPWKAARPRLRDEVSLCDPRRLAARRGGPSSCGLSSFDDLCARRISSRCTRSFFGGRGT